jgi:hypothetical protein
MKCTGLGGTRGVEFDADTVRLREDLRAVKRHLLRAGGKRLQRNSFVNAEVSYEEARYLLVAGSFFPGRAHEEGRPMPMP